MACILAHGLAIAGIQGEQCSYPQSIINSVRVIVSSKIQLAATVVIRCAKIPQVLTKPNNYQSPADAVVFDGRRKTLLPGLIDG